MGDRASLVKEPGRQQKHLAAIQFSIAKQHGRLPVRNAPREKQMALAMVGWRDKSLRCRLLTACRVYRAIPWNALYRNNRSEKRGETYGHSVVLSRLSWPAKAEIRCGDEAVLLPCDKR